MPYMLKQVKHRKRLRNTPHSRLVFFFFFTFHGLVSNFMRFFALFILFIYFLFLFFYLFIYFFFFLGGGGGGGVAQGQTANMEIKFQTAQGAYVALTTYCTYCLDHLLVRKPLF